MAASIQKSALLFALLNTSDKLSKDWTEWHAPLHYRKMLLGLCLSHNCSTTAFDPFHFLPTNVGQGTVAVWVLWTKSKTYPHWAVAIDSGCDSPWRLLTSFPLSVLWQSGAAWVSCSSRSDLLFAAGCQSIKASHGPEQSFIMDHFSPSAPPQHPGSELNTSAGNPLAVRLWNEGWCFKRGVTRWLFLAGRPA